MIERGHVLNLKRILMVVGKLDVGGAETFIMNLYRKIDKDKYQFDFVVHGDDIGYFEEEILSSGGKIYRSPKYNGINHLQYLQFWDNFIVNHTEYRIYHFHIRSTANIVMKLIKNKYKDKISTIAHSHSTSNGGGISGLAKNLNMYGLRKYSDFKIACSNEAGEWLFGKNSDFVVMQNGINETKFTFDDRSRKLLRNQLKIQQKIAIGHVGRFEKMKNHNFIINVFVELLKFNKDYELILVGEGSQKNDMISKVKDLGIENKVHFLGIRGDVSDLMNAMDIFIFPSIYEGIPLTLVEAQSTNLPCFVSDNISEEINFNEEYKVLSLSDSPLDWARKINEFQMQKDRNRSNIRIAQNGYSSEMICKQLLALYDEILGE